MILRKTSVLYRLMSPGSEWRMHRDWYDDTAVRDLLGEGSHTSKATLNGCLDRLVTHKDGVLEFLRDRSAEAVEGQQLIDTSWIEFRERNTGGATVPVRNDVIMTVANVVANYIVNSVQPDFILPATYDTGFVNIIAEVKGGCVAVPATWTVNYPKFTEKFGSDFTKALAMKTGKKDGAGNDMFVWQDYVAGTDPTDETDVFTASITIVDGEVKVSYTPELDDAHKALRKYTTWGKKSLLDAGWTVVEPGKEADYNFFKVTVEMK